MKVSIFVHSLESNPIVRAKPFADALQSLGHEVEVLGLLFGDDKVYAPYRDSFDYLTLTTTGSIPDVVAKSWKLSKMATGEVVYSFKPLLSTFLPALLNSGFGKSKPIFLDVEDDDVFSRAVSLSDGIRRNLGDMRRVIAYRLNMVLHRYVQNCSGVTVSSSKLKSIYGGEIVLNGPKVIRSVCEIGSEEQRILRKRFDLPEDKILLLFAGKPVLHKGFKAIQEAVQTSVFRKYFHLALAGPSVNGIYESVKEAAGDHCSVLGMISHDKIHDLVQAADMIPTIQVNVPYAESQIPAKLLEAMACGRPSIVTKVGDLPDIVGGDATDMRGWVIADATGKSLVKFLEAFSQDIESAKLEMKIRGLSARSFYIKNCSIEVIAEKLGQFPLLASSNLKEPT